MFGWKSSALLVALAMLDPFRSTALLVPLQIQLRQAHACQHSARYSSSSSSSSSTYDTHKNTVFIKGLMNNLSKLCDRYIMNGSPKIREQVFNVLDQIAAEAVDKEMIQQSIRMVKRAGVPMYVKE